MQEATKTRKIHPQKFALWLACASMVMMFAGFTSAYVVRQAAGNWLEFRLPNLFFYSTVVILLSSVTLHASYYFFKKLNTQMYRILLLLTAVLGVAFIGLQYQGWQALTEIGATLDANPSASFIYVISGAHAAHVLGGIGVLVYALIHAFALPHIVSDKRKKRFQLTLTYWHFVDFLWIYLITFLVVQA